jgi:hypothetical protein
VQRSDVRIVSGAPIIVCRGRAGGADGALLKELAAEDKTPWHESFAAQIPAGRLASWVLAIIEQLFSIYAFTTSLVYSGLSFVMRSTANQRVRKCPLIRPKPDIAKTALMTPNRHEAQGAAHRRDGTRDAAEYISMTDRI